jgi:agmatinase
MGAFSYSRSFPSVKKLAERLYRTDVAGDWESAWEDSLQRIRRVKTILLAVPSDAGASLGRGAHLGPLGIRDSYLTRFGQYAKDTIDLGDVVVIPQLLSDDMLHATQLASCRKSLYPDIQEELPVSPLSIAQAVLQAIEELNPEARLILLGGDHSVSHPFALALSRRVGSKLGLVQIDSETGLQPERLGIRLCHSTWAYEVSRALPPFHLCQVGIQHSARPKAFWEETLSVRQIWSEEVKDREGETIVKIAQHFKAQGVEQLILSLSTKACFEMGEGKVPALSPTFVMGLIQKLRDDFRVVGSDIVEANEEISCRLGAEFLACLS